MKTRISCELCNADAMVYCPSDSAFLCRSCDGKVHGANFLVARHLRPPVCSECNGIIVGDGAASVGFQRFPSICWCSPAPAQAPAGVDDVVSLSSSICVSSTSTPKRVRSVCREACGFNDSYSGNNSSGEVTSDNTTKSIRSRAPSTVDVKARGVFINWCTRLGLSDDVTVRIASDALRICLDQRTVLPFRVCLAASMWLGLRFGRSPTLQALKRLEEISGVPAKLIAATESKLERLLRARRRQKRSQRQLVEGWGEC